MSSPKDVLVRPAALKSALPTCIVHPTTGQLMAPGSKVWPYFTDHKRLGTHWIGLKHSYPDYLQASILSLTTSTDNMSGKGSGKKRSRKNGNKKSKADETNSLPTRTTPILSSTTSDAMTDTTEITGHTTKVSRSSPDGPDAAEQVEPSLKFTPSGRRIYPATTKSVAPLPAPTQPASKTIPAATEVPPTLTRSRPSRRANIDKQFNDMLLRRSNLLQSGKKEEAYLIQAAVNVGIMWDWTKEDQVESVNKLEVVVGNNREGFMSDKMMEIAGEIERLLFLQEQSYQHMRTLREHFKGRSYDGTISLEESAGRKLRAPGLLLLIQASLSAAFVKTLDNAKQEDEEFHDGVYDGKAVLYFRVPNKVCVEEREYLANMSRFGTKESQAKKMAACPGIERALKGDEKRTVLKKVQEEVEGGEKVIYLATTLFVRPDKVKESGEEDEGNVVDIAMKNLGDDGFLVLEHVYRKKFGQSILVGDAVVEGEEEEEEEEEKFEDERPSLVVTLRYRRDSR